MSRTTGELSGYLRRVERALDCPPGQRRALMERVQRDLERFLDEQPEATAEEAAAYLGDPEELAQGLLETLDPKELERYRRKGVLLRRGVVLLVIAALVVALIGTCLYARHLRKNQFQITVIEASSTHISQELPDPYTAL